MEEKFKQINKNELDKEQGKIEKINLEETTTIEKSKELSEHLIALKKEENNLEANRKIFKKYLLLFIVIFLIAGSFFLGLKKGESSFSSDSGKIPLDKVFIQHKLSPDKTVDFSLFWKVWDLVKEKHIDRNKLNAQKMIYGAINGMLKATGDPYTDFFNPKQSKDFSQDIKGSFEGIGAELGMKDHMLTVVTPLDGSPAKRAGLRSGDKILKVNNNVIAGLPIDQAVNLIRGKKGTKVILTVLHQGDKKTSEITIKRDIIEIKSVKLKFKKDQIAYVRITKFSENTAKEFDEATNKILEKGSKGIILDLRNDPGGLLDKAVSIASRMIPKGKVVVSEENSAGKKEALYTLGGDKLSSIPMVVLINEGSASAAEILAGALKDDRGITLIGKKSFGKGSVQQLMDLPGGSSIKITVAKWLTPNGDYIMKKGIQPDIKVDFTLNDYKKHQDPQLAKALSVIKSKLK